MSFGIQPPSALGELEVASRRNDPAPHDHGEGQVCTFAASATWAGPRRGSGRERGELAIANHTVTFSSRSGNPTFTLSGGAPLLSLSPLRAVLAFQDGATRVRVSVTRLSRRRLERALRDAGLLK